MGCDIHVFIEHSDGRGGRWSAISDQIYLGRNYGLFSAMAGVRLYTDTIEYFEPRGVPKDICFLTEGKYTLLVVAGEDTHEDGCCTEEQADKYLGYGSAIWEEKKEGSEYYRITGPDWHTPSWLNLEEFKIAYNRYLDYYKDEYGKRDKSDPSHRPNRIPLVEGYLSLMDKLEDMGFPTRIVFWCDN